MKWIINNLDELSGVAADFFKNIGDKKIFALYGPMGVGKTTFVKAIAACEGVLDDVSSPTFAIVNEYQTAKGNTIYHFDFYRIKDATEAMDFGYEEYFFGGNQCFIEWPEKVAELIPEEAVACYFSELPDGKRLLEIKE
ncbi:tRNA (adenosine(37)-N6)-threonylcarbamoyltransferase complex ATPase subunit type 1 TsaE [Odoribacter lunatus]|uniref:tRNA (adenosine(37)-N6)-threonylcarbamoyltransferase complex ATPase subunit type 1 TsaE n=1 Tax=Odoribacter lunatus TaxID=2941335 RepID=UPI00203CE88C|nr:tRNA (adenosine(37)-N6)-threonylcarbamoyltransferase complex ATPase subunit type 1 TsaE [Odoribacter lunatus]